MTNNVYPVWWDYPITIYNQYLDSTTKTVSWYRTTLNDCFWKQASSLDETNSALSKTSYIVCRIPQNSKYQSARKWRESSSDNKLRHFTLQQNDIIVLGKVSDTINEYQSGSRSTDLLTKYQGECMIIENFSIDTMTGINTPHYKVIGK